MRAVKQSIKKKGKTYGTKWYSLNLFSLVDITPKGIDTLKRLNVIAAFDFRSDPEIERQGVMP